MGHKKDSGFLFLQNFKFCPAVVLAAGIGVVAVNRLGFAVAFCYQARSRDSFCDQVVHHRFGAAVAQL